MKENFLHFLWRTRRFDLSNLTTTDGQPLEILDFGTYNRLDAGADFQNAKIRLDALIWHGNIEMHVKSSDWYAHHHERDAAYRAVILHVVYENDALIFRHNTEGGATTHKNTDGENIAETIPCLVLKNRVPQGIYQNYWALLNNEHWIPCQHHFFKIANFTKDMWLERLLVERLERKTLTMNLSLERNQGNWEETFWQSLARYFGAKVNAEPMEMLACGLPHLILAKHKNQLLQLEALLFGQAGFLDTDFADDYPNQLKKEYAFLKHKYQLPPSVNAAAWKFSRLRPANFPTIRLAQLAGLIHRSSHLFSKIIDAQLVTSYGNLFDIEVSGYWRTHFRLDAPPSVFSEKRVGQDMIQLLLINVVAPFLFLYGKNRRDEDVKTRAFDLLDSLKPEKNTITEGWQNLGSELKNAARTQSLIQLKNEYCDKRACLDCAIGVAILKE